MPFDHLVALAGKAKERKREEVPKYRRAKPHLVFSCDVKSQIVAGKMGDQQTPATIAGLPERQHGNIRHIKRQFLTDTRTLFFQNSGNPVVDFFKVYCHRHIRSILAETHNAQTLTSAEDRPPLRSGQYLMRTIAHCTGNKALLTKHMTVQWRLRQL